MFLIVIYFLNLFFVIYMTLKLFLQFFFYNIIFHRYLKLNISIRDYIIWVKFIETMMNQLPEDDNNYNSTGPYITLFKEGALMIFLDKRSNYGSLYVFI